MKIIPQVHSADSEGKRRETMIGELRNLLGMNYDQEIMDKIRACREELIE